MIVRIQMRRGLKSEWESADPILSDGEIGVERDTGDFKIGNGVKSWSELDYANTSLVDGDEFDFSDGVLRIAMDKYQVGSNTPVLPTDNIIQALGKLQAQINALK